ncbi:MAG: hypothetical protein A2X17_08435 [Bacteroidetes bacterium GWF2_41_61]|nr:MAG: hypothetical protein A2X20_11415 [Bacteroidetes bacterium GWE2_40_15]OFY27106.1 MAG: hypothetical protein A2X17_08435 [Bacteroidetes bacterium GWF2_41_61]OFY90201.1 MAG: hypothetical protein A2266_06315 [Bacteroidetes bacterium RIFOXYA12_FULL_40_10]HBZ24957.1 LytTR family transcriptional regulator [Rikenellaceae bacterium]
MKRNPLIESYNRKVTWTAVTVIVTAVIWSLLALYGNISIVHALVGSLTYTILLAASGYLYWFMTEYIRPIQAQIVIAIINQVLIISITYAVATISGMEQPGHFTKNIPIFATVGLLSWIILAQWYRANTISDIKESENIASEESAEKADEERSNTDVLDKISVKEGSHIYIIHLSELLYIQAYGDYVMLFTENSKHIKEQTMRYFETHLPETFVRIHRSCIVNSEKIARAELFGKESYNIHLKNGTCLKASATGYKLLKERLLL